MTTDAMEVDASSSSGKPGGATKKKSSGYQVPFVEKWRPKTLDDVVGNEETVSRLRAIAKTGNLPNLILSGPPGTGYEYFLVTVLPPNKTLPRKTCLVFFFLTNAIFISLYYYSSLLPTGKPLQCTLWRVNCSVAPTRMRFWN